jgi:cellulose biosynthesis protein BcsQ
VSIGLGCYYSMRLKQPTLLLELDSSPGDFGALFDIEPQISIDMAMRFPEECRKCIKKVQQNLDILKGMANPIIAESVAKGQLLSMVEKIAGDYTNIIIDTQSVLNGLVLDALSFSRHILLITECSIESFNRVLNFNEMLTNNFEIAGDKISLIVNKKQRPDFLKVWDISKMSGHPVSGFIEYDRHFNKSLVITGMARMAKTRFYKQLCRIIENEFKGKA